MTVGAVEKKVKSRFEVKSSLVEDNALGLRASNIVQPFYPRPQQDDYAHENIFGNKGKAIYLLRALEVYCLLLPSDPEFLDDDPVSFDIFLFQIVEQSSSLPDNLQKPPAAVMIFFVNLEMFRQVGDPFGENGYLHFRGSRIIVMQLERTNDCLLFIRCQHCSHLLSLKFYSRKLHLSSDK
jgi:hypothetical protein